MIYTITLNPAIDCTVSLEKLCTGRVNRCSDESITIGGKGINVSRVLKELDEPTTALGFRAGFTGKAIAEGLEAMGINLFKNELSDCDYVTVSDALKGAGYIHKDLENEDIIHIDDTIEEDFERDVNNGQEYSCDACDIACLVIPPIWGELHATSTQDPVE